MKTFPCTCPVCHAMGSLSPDFTLPEIYTRGHFNCGTRCMYQRVGGNKTSRRIWIDGNCYRRFLAQRAEQLQEMRKAAA